MLFPFNAKHSFYLKITTLIKQLTQNPHHPMLKSYYFLIPFLAITACNQTSQTNKTLSQQDSLDLIVEGTPANVHELIISRERPVFNNPLPASLATFIPSGYEPMDTISTDLNMDSINDFILVSCKIREDSIHPSPKRNLKILLGQTSNQYRLAGESWSIIPPVDEGGMMDPYPGIVVDKGKFIIQFFGGSNWKGTSSMLFEYSPADKDWLLTRPITESYYLLDKRHYQSDTLLEKDLGKILFIKEYCQ